MEGKRFEDIVRILIYVQLFLTSVCGAEYLDVRLVNGSNNASGRVEVSYNGTWGTVCDDGWDLNDANVVCKMLGFFDASSAPGMAAYGAGYGEIHLDEVDCTGSESSLEDCIKSEFGVHNCDHSEDAGVTCRGTMTVCLIFFNSTYRY
ncbi:galectin-3-binding protein-like [Strongylocentrotus purpuratus]|uniref:SRCR domain-containing protein n=1 Tax=Strongylocentrotus purpuratus TaxID=7668 RepID=A0A7M7NFC6_STRPU|nr:galectin-3-binding protein-like [Strongylocentrotus purpuratus]